MLQWNMLMMYLKSVDCRIHSFASSIAAPAIRSLPRVIVVAVPELSINLGSSLSIKPMNARNLSFHECFGLPFHTLLWMLVAAFSIDASWWYFVKISHLVAVMWSMGNCLPACNQLADFTCSPRAQFMHIVLVCTCIKYKQLRTVVLQLYWRARRERCMIGSAHTNCWTCATPASLRPLGHLLPIVEALQGEEFPDISHRQLQMLHVRQLPEASGHLQPSRMQQWLGTYTWMTSWRYPPGMTHSHGKSSYRV